ncbi:MAG TPA: AMP-binding protein [Polyangia bacterium]|nr:AMP-binding protein [Polyangia bacterium]
MIEAIGLGPRSRPPGAPCALGETPRTWGDLLADAAAIGRRLPGGDGAGAEPALMVACTDRYHFAAALLAVWRVGRMAALPPNGRPETIDALCAAEDIPLVLHDGGGSGGMDVRALLTDGGGSGDETAAAAAAFAQTLRFGAARPLVRVHTSGSSGASVACDKTAGQILGEALVLIDLFALGPEARVLATVPPHHIYGLLFGVLVPLWGGGAFLRSTPHHAETIAAQATAFGANVLCSVPAHLQGIGALAPGALPAIKQIVSSGAPLPATTAAAVIAVCRTAVTEIFGSTETGGMAWRQSGAAPAERAGDTAESDAWQALPGVRVTADDDGIMRVRSPFADGGDRADGARGADRVALLGDGRFRLLGRADAILKIGGQRIATTEVERRLREIAGVRDAAVIGVAVAGLHQHEMWAAVAGAGLSVPILRAALGRWLDPIAIPRRFRLVAALPREENGKLPRATIEALFAAPASIGAEDAVDEVTLTETIPVDAPYFQGHFADFPLVPGVVQLHQLVLRPLVARWPQLRHLRKVQRLKFRRPIRPGETLAIELRREDLKVSFAIRGPRGPVSGGVLVFEKAAD